MSALNYQVEVLDGITYTSTTNARGTFTMIFNMCGTTFVQVNSSPAKALDDIAKPSKDVVALLAIMEA